MTAEIEENAPEEVQKQHRWLLGLVSNQLVVDDEVAELANSYVERSILTSNYYHDALHVALASVNSVEVLVSWNFRHIVHFDRRFNVVNRELGYRAVEIRSPREVTNYGSEEQGI